MILKTIEAIESHLDTGIGGAGRLHSYSTTNYMAIIQSEMEQLYPIHDPVSELQFWLIRIFAALSVIVLLIFLFLHD